MKVFLIFIVSIFKIVFNYVLLLLLDRIYVFVCLFEYQGYYIIEQLILNKVKKGKIIKYLLLLLVHYLL